MFYKIINTDCDLYKQLYAQREKEKQAEIDNKKRVDEIVGFKWSKFYGYKGQQNFSRVTEYYGFIPLDESEVDTKKWRRSKDLTNAYVPNMRTRVGREIKNRLNNELQTFDIEDIYDILGLVFPVGHFSFPVVEIVDDVIVIYLDDKQEPSDPNLIEITKKEFKEILKKTGSLIL